MKRLTMKVTVIAALVALIIFTGVSSAQQSAASSGQCNINPLETPRTRHDISDNNPLECCCHQYPRHCPTILET